MSARGLVPREVIIPFGVGLNQKADPRAMQVGSLSRCLDAAFTEIGGLQTRYPYASIGTDIYGGGSVSDCRRIVENGSELLLFTKTALYSWNATLSKWVLKGTHLAVKVEESPAFVTTGDQVAADRAELNGTVVYAWADPARGVYVAAVDKITGNVLLVPTLTGADERPRLLALTTKILLFGATGDPDLVVYSIDPAAPSIASVAVLLASPDFNLCYDACRVGTTDTAIWAARRTTTTSYQIGTITAALVAVTATVARTCTHAIAVSCPSTAATVQVIRSSTLNVQGDYITIAGFVDVTTAQAVGTIPAGTVSQIAACHRSTTDSGAYRCYAFWHRDETSSVTEFLCKSNWVDTGGTLGTQGTFMSRLGLASRAFDHEGRIYVWGVFAGASGVGFRAFGATLQNTYFLLRDDAFLVAKATAAKAGGFPSNALVTIGCLPGVALTDGTTGYAWCGVERQVIPLGAKQSGYGARAPRDIKFTFDSNEARRTARLGQTLYITGGEILQYDGVGLYEVGFHIYPWFLSPAQTGGGDIADGTYAYKGTLRWDNAKGEIERSTTATVATIEVSGGPGEVTLTSPPLYLTHKTATVAAYEYWRTAVNPTEDAPFYLVTSKDPAVTSNPNRYVSNDTTLALTTDLIDELADEDLIVREASAENGTLLECLAPPAATIIYATADRIFLAGVAGDPHRVWYSRQRQDGEVASFHDALTVDVPRAGGDITAITVRDGVLYVWRETATYAFPGDGFDNLGGGQNFGPSRLISSDVGCVSAEALAQTSTGFVFKSSKGWYALEGASVQYIGDKISDYDSDTVYAVHILEGQHQIRVLTSARMLVFDTNVQQWAEWSVSDGLHACMWSGTYHYAVTGGVKAEQTTYDAISYGMDVETAWIPLGNVQGFGRVWKILVLGECQSAGYLQMRLYRNWSTAAAFQTKNWEMSPTTVGGPMQVKHGPSIQEMQAIKIRITAIDMFTPEGEDPDPPYAVTPTADIFKLSFLTLELGVERHLARLPLSQTQ